MKKRLFETTIFILLTYFLLVLFNNWKDIVKNIINNNGDIHIMNISIILSILLLSILFILRKKIFNMNKYLAIIYINILLFNAAEGFVSDFVVFPFIILYFYLLIMTYCVILIKKYKFEISIITSFSLLIILAFIIGMFGLLCIYKYIMIALLIIMTIFIIKKYKNDKNELIEARDILFDEGFIIFNILWLLAILCGMRVYVHTWDEYSHWAYDAKAMIFYDKFGASQEIMSKTKSYAPIITVWHYIVSIFNNFSEHNLYVGLNMYLSLFMLPIFNWIKNNHTIIKMLAIITIFSVPVLFGSYSYTSLYADLTITILFTAILILFEMSKEENKNYNLPLVLLFAIITLVKPNGFVIAFVALLINFMDQLLHIKHFKIKKIFEYIWFYIKEYYKYILSIIITLIIWKIYLIIMNSITVEYYDNILIPQVLDSGLQYKLNKEFIVNFIIKIVESFDNTILMGSVKLTLFQYLVLLFTSIFVVKYSTSDIKEASKTTAAYIIGYIAFIALTALAMFVTFSYYEASQLKSFGRYLGWYHLGVLFVVLAMILKNEMKEKIKFPLIIYIILLLIIPFSSIVSPLTNPINSESAGKKLMMENKFKIVNEKTPDNSMVYVIDQKDKDGIMAMWYFRYYAFPRQSNASAGSINWKIKTKKNIDDLKDWGLTSKTWEKQLKDYKFEYVFLYTKDKEFYEVTKSMYSDYDKAKKSSLFKIEQKDNKLVLVPIQ